MPPRLEPRPKNAAGTMEAVERVEIEPRAALAVAELVGARADRIRLRRLRRDQRTVEAREQEHERGRRLLENELHGACVDQLELVDERGELPLHVRGRLVAEDLIERVAHGFRVDRLAVLEPGAVAQREDPRA